VPPPLPPPASPSAHAMPLPTRTSHPHSPACLGVLRIVRAPHPLLLALPYSSSTIGRRHFWILHCSRMGARLAIPQPCDILLPVRNLNTQSIRSATIPASCRISSARAPSDPYASAWMKGVVVGREARAGAEGAGCERGDCLDEAGGEPHPPLLAFPYFSSTIGRRYFWILRCSRMGTRLAVPQPCDILLPVRNLNTQSIRSATIPTAYRISSARAPSAPDASAWMKGVVVGREARAGAEGAGCERGDCLDEAGGEQGGR
jgi:hypothetical protein